MFLPRNSSSSLRRDIPLSLGIAVSIVMLAYVGGAAALTLMVPYHLIDPTAPFPSAYDYCQVYWAKYVISIGALAAMLACLLAILFVVPRYLLAMSRDGLLWDFLGRVHPATQVSLIEKYLMKVEYTKLLEVLITDKLVVY